MKPISMTRVIDGKRYSTKTATLIAHDVFWDGNNWERSGRNRWLYRTPGGAFFLTEATMWQGERDTLEPMSDEAARHAYEQYLPEHEMTWAEAFNVEPEEPVGSAGRPPLYNGQPMRQTAVWLPAEMIEWLKSQPDGMGAAMRALISAAMQ